MLKKNKVISRTLQTTLNAALLGLAVILVLFLFKETYFLAMVFIHYSSFNSAYSFIDGIVIYFLYFEFIALIAKYFQSNYHFPLRYFIYIGVTAIIRLIIADHNNPKTTLLYAGAILLLVCALYIANLEKLKRS